MVKLNRRRLPSERDWEIYDAVVEKHCTQKNVAGLFGITQSRVSQIVDKVRRWQRASEAFGAQHVGEVRDLCDRLDRKLRQRHELAEHSPSPDETLDTMSAEEHRRWMLHREGETARQCLRLCREIIFRYPQLVALGQLLAPLPKYDAHRLMHYAQAEYRRLTQIGNRHSDPKSTDCLPPEWAKLYWQIAASFESFTEIEATNSSEPLSENGKDVRSGNARENFKMPLMR